jgi:hypothetical protein
MDRPIDSTAAQQTLVCGVDNNIHGFIESCDVVIDEFNLHDATPL